MAPQRKGQTKVRARPNVIVLAAGRSSRHAGSTHKLEQSVNGASVLAHTLRNAVASHLPVLVVTIAALEPLVRRLVASRDVVVLPDLPPNTAAGIGASIAAGVAASSGAAGWLVLPGDMPLVQPSSLVAVARALEEHPVAYAQHRGRRGHPVGFGVELYSELIALTGDEGARRLVARYPSLGVDVDDAGVLIDVDSDADLEAVRANLLRPGGEISGLGARVS